MNSLLSSEEAFSCRLWNRGYWPIFVVQLQRSRAGRFLYLQDKYESRGSVGCNIDTIFGHRIVRTISPFLLLPPLLVTHSSPSPNSFMAPTAEGGKPNRHEQRIWRASEGETNAFGKAFPVPVSLSGAVNRQQSSSLANGPRDDRAARCMPDA